MARDYESFILSGCKVPEASSKTERLYHILREHQCKAWNPTYSGLKISNLLEARVVLPQELYDIPTRWSANLIETQGWKFTECAKHGGYVCTNIFKVSRDCRLLNRALDAGLRVIPLCEF